LKKGGSTIWVKLNVSAYSKEKGKPESLIGIVENITNEKKAEKALQESEDRYRKLSDLSLEGIVLHQNGVAIDCNECFLDMSGYSREELIGKNFVELFADKNSIDLVLAKIQSNDLSPYEAIGRGKSGDSIPVELENRNVEYDGEMFRVTAFRDITERKKSEQEIRKLNIAIDQSPSSIVITDKEGKIEYVNKAFYEITGYSMDETLGSNPNVLKTDYHPNEYYKQLWNTISSGKTWHGIFRNKAKSGAYYWERAVISPIIDERKNITHYLAIKENITKEKKAQEALKISEEHHRIISELTNDFVYSAFIKNEKLSLGWKSGTLEKLSGYSITEIREMEYGWYSVVLKDDFESIIIPAINKLRIEKVLNFEYRIKTKSGKLKWVSDKVKFIERKDVSGKMNVIGAIRDITLRKEANLALDQSKKYLDSIIDNLPVGLQIYDEYGYTARINESQRKLLGLKDLNVGKGSFNILNDPLSIAIGSDKRFREVYEKKKTVSYEVELNFEGKGNEWGTKKGKVEIHQIIFPIFKEDGNIHSVISLSNDITKRVSAEKALKASEMHQKALLRIIPDLIFTFTKDGVFKDVYTEDPGKLLLPTDQIIGKPFSEIFSRALSEKFYTYLNKAVETNEMQVYNYKLDVNGIVNYYETRLLVSKENEVIAIIRDDTDNIVAERALKESEEKFRELAERTQDALVLISTTNEILYVSPNLISILGISPESYTNNPLDALKLIHQDDKHWIIPELNNYRKGKQESLNLQFRVILEDGTQKWIWYRESTVFDEHDNPSRYAAVITDISASKIAEQELKIAKEEAEKASRSKSAFLANISHEIRTPMNAVLGFSDLLYSRINDPVRKGYLNSIKSSGNTLLNLLNDILDLSKIEAEKMSIIPSPINLFSVFDEIKHIFSLK
ncbi:MAG: PAS domain S-box protein, partial [Cyclobacteriaceae bacterium]|nr:PAS domain S-box protein [Cyclobacteriaceae bacterium]